MFACTTSTRNRAIRPENAETTASDAVSPPRHHPNGSTTTFDASPRTAAV